MLTDDVMKLMANIIKPNNFKNYEFCFDERDNCFKLRLFITETNYFVLILKDGEDKCLLREYQVNKSYYHPAEKVHYINKYFKKFRCGYNYHCKLTIDEFLKVLPKVTTNLLAIDDEFKRGTYYGWRSIRRATSDY